MDIFTNFDSNGAADDSQDFPMTTPQNSPMTNSGGAAGSSGTTANNTTNNNAVNNNSTTTAPAKSVSTENQPILTKPRLLELVRDVDVTAQLDEDVEEIADDFVDDTVKATCAFAKHRKASKAEVRDVQLHLERKWKMWIPGFGTDELRPYKRAAITEAHKQRLALIRKTIKKY